MTDKLLHMSQKEIDRHSVLKQLIAKTIKRMHAAKLLKLSLRHVTRLKQAVEEFGAEALVNKQRKQPSHNRIPEKERETIVRLLKDTYPDFGATFAAEKLRELHEIGRDPETIRAIQVKEGLIKPKKAASKDEHRVWRQRRPAFGEMEQFDGSYEDWFEGRGGIGEACLLASIDDAAGRITQAEFAPHEGVFPVFAFWKRYLEAHGKPRSIYMDKFSTYKMNSAAAKLNPDLKTQFQRALTALQIEPIFAESPEAKGRIERFFETAQDRLVKEMRLAGISNVEDANRFLKEKFIPAFNEKFSVAPSSDADLHRPLTAKEKKSLPSVFARQETRIVNNDFTFSFQSQWYQLTPRQPVTVCKKDEVTVEEDLDHVIHIRLRGKELNVTILPERPKKAAAPTVIAKSAVPTVPAPDHPWRKRLHADARKIHAKKVTF